ncbi:hypothetical protein F0562_003270 [Nyssa sinensis]|uniref:C2H2-type domain-containing protein n=1 Tax=Nyssa sinensis TaxID=561372 RepID=A0A5J5BVU4_9ASTE|nr:hypothetical protein F0562_003270 [Nyssa sinensis]
MPNSGQARQIPVSFVDSARPPGAATDDAPLGCADRRVPLLNLCTVRSRMDSLQLFLSDSVNNNTLIGKDQMEMVSTEIASAIRQVIVNGAALLACSRTQTRNPSAQHEDNSPRPHQIAYPGTMINTVNGESLANIAADLKFSDKLGDDDVKIPMTTTNSICINKDKGGADLKVEAMDEEMKNEIGNDDWEIIELDAVELLAEHVHFCDICGKGFKRDANLRMHMRAHGNQFKTPEALAKPQRCSSQMRRRTRFSCPFVGCNRNKLHKKFRPLKSAICVKNHFKRSHCPKMYLCNRCNKKSFSVVADLKSHLKHCGESKWRCSCGTSFSRKDKLFGHMALFEGHMPAVVEEDAKAKGAAMMEDEEDEDALAMAGANYLESGIEIEEWERRDLEPPPHLLAEEEEEERENMYGFPITHFTQDSQNQLTNLSKWAETSTSNDDGVNVRRHPNVGLESGIDKKRFGSLRSIGVMVICAITKVLMILRTEIRKRLKNWINTLRMTFGA